MHEPFSFTRADFTIPLVSANIHGITTDRAKKKEPRSISCSRNPTLMSKPVVPGVFSSIRKRGVIVWEYPDGDELFPRAKISPYGAPIPVF